MKEQPLTGNPAGEIWIGKLTTLPKVVGGYRLGKQTSDYVQFTMTYKPKWFHRQMMKIFFGWYWFNEK
jgi:hypothetical protein